MPRNTTRRTFLKGIGATAATAGMVGTASAYSYRESTRFSVFNIVELQTEQVQEKGDEQAEYAARIIQEADPDVIAIKELDNNFQKATVENVPTEKSNVRAFIDNYLMEPQAEHLDPISFPYTLQPDSNTGLLPEEDYDFNKDGEAGARPGDAYGFGMYPGHYGFAIASQYPIIEDDVRTFQEFVWTDMPNNLAPVDDGSMALNKGDGDIWLTEEEAEVFRLSSKNHVDVPIRVDGEVVHGLVAHPTPPGFDGSNNFNDRWNHDEVRFWADYVAGAEYIYDDDGNEGGLAEDEPYVLMGDMNAGPTANRVMHASEPFFFENEDFYTEQLPTSTGGRVNGNEYATRIDGDFEGVVEQVDYVLPSPEFEYADGGVVWPVRGRAQSEMATAVAEASDHRMVWADVNLESDAGGASSAELRSLLQSLLSSVDDTPGRGQN